MIYTVDEIKKRITPLAEKHQLRAVYIFGSYARNEATDASDVDFLIDRKGSPIKGLFKMGGLYNELCEILEKDIDLITTDTLEQDDVKNKTPWFVENIEKEKVKIYEKY